MSNRPYIQGNSVWLTTLAFKQLFHDLEIRNYSDRYGSNDTVTRRLKVDVGLDTKERIYDYLMAGGHAELEQADVRLPRISIQMDGIEPDMARHKGKGVKRLLNTTKVAGGSTQYTYDFQPVPMNMNFTVGIWCKKMEHYCQIVENILGWFESYVTVGVKERNYGIERELCVKFNGHNQEMTFEMQGGQERVIRGSMNFTVETVAYKTMETTQTGIIEKVEVHVIDIITPWSSETIEIKVDEDDVI